MSSSPKSQWFNTKHPGIRYREHATRKFNRRLDRYIVVRYKRNGKLIGEAYGWETEGATVEEAANIRGQIIQNIRLGSGFQSIVERREIEGARRDAEIAEKQAVEKENTPFDVLAQRYLDWSKENKKSWKDDASRYRHHIKPILGKIPITDISVLTLEGLKKKLKNKNIQKGARSTRLAEITIKHCLVIVRQIFNRGIGWGMYHKENPICETLRLDKKFLKTSDSRRLRFITKQEARDLLKEIKIVSPQTHDICLLSIHTGMRMGEIFDLVWGDISVENGLINIRKPKNAESRTAYMTPQLKEMFGGLDKKSSSKGDLLFKDTKGKRISQLSDTFNRAVDKLKLNEGVKDRQNKIVPHSLRHTFASWLAQQGETLLHIKELMGHKSIETTMRYAHLIPDQKHEAVLKLAKSL
jgi:integrase